MADDAKTSTLTALKLDLLSDGAERAPSPNGHKPKRMDRGLSRELRREAKYYANLIPEVLASIGLDHWIRKEARPSPIVRLLTGKRSRQKIKILHVAFHEQNIFLRIDPLRLPYQVTTPMLHTDEVLETLSLACGRQVTFELADYGKGAWFVVHRAGVISKLPKLFEIRDALANIKPDARPLVYVAGVAENMRLVHVNMEDEHSTHLLIAGAPGMGKSVHLNSILCQLIWRNSADLVKFAMIDLKGGMELRDYEKSPYLWKPLVTSVEGVKDLLIDFKQEMQRRQKILGDANARSIREYNAHRTNKMPYLMLIIDELALVLRDPNSEIRDRAMLELGAILNVSRATGGHCMLCTQRPSVDVISGYLKATISARIAFGVPTQADSRVIIDNSNAADIDIPGRAWMLHGARAIQMQTPWITPKQIRTIIGETTKRETERDNPGVTVEEIVRIALNKFDGRLSRNLLKPELGERISWNALQKMLSDIDGEVVTDGTYQYHVVTDSNPTIGRILERVDFDNELNVTLNETEEVLNAGDSSSW